MYNSVVELLPELMESFTEHSMFDCVEEGDLISFLPIEEDAVGESFLAETNKLLADHFEVGPEEEQCYAAGAYADKVDNPVLFWKDYLGCFFNFELVEEGADASLYLGTTFGTYRIMEITYIDEVNKRLKQRRLNGIRLEYKVKGTPMDRNKHWNRTYDKEF